MSENIKKRSKDDSGAQRKFVPAFAELVDRLTVDQIKEVLLPSQAVAAAEEMEKISHDIDLLVSQRSLNLTSRLLRMVIAIAQLNVHIWNNKERMQQEPEKYMELLKLAHQLNGLRNQIKNMLLQEAGDHEGSAQRTNFNTDGLEGWAISLLKGDR